MGHRFDVKHASRLLSEDRARLLPAEVVLDKLELSRGQQLVDIGVGPGFFAIPAAERGAIVYGVDVEPKMLEMLQARAAEQGLQDNVHPVLSDAQAIAIADGVSDRVLYAFVLHEVASRPDALKEVARMLKAAGRVMILEWRPIATEFGPPLHERLQESEVAQELEQAGFQVLETWYPNDQHYAVIAQK